MGGGKGKRGGKGKGREKGEGRRGGEGKGKEGRGERPYTPLSQIPGYATGCNSRESRLTAMKYL